MQELMLFLMSFIFVLIVYEIFIVSRAKKNEKKKKENKQPVEIKYLIHKYKFDLKKIDYHKLLHVCAVVSSFDVALIVSLASIFDNSLLQLLVAAVLITPVFLISYRLIYFIYKKRGLI